MNLTRRQALITAISAAAVAGFVPRSAMATTMEEAMAAFTGGAEATEGGAVIITAPEIAENGNTVPVEVAAEGAARITIFASGNPNPEVVTFAFGPLAAAQRASTRIRLAGTQDVIVVAEMADGSYQMAAQEVKVTIGGCGG
ncbi:thiosulfate oxidation carrier protein SoxY [Nioella nitratireducens]|uniref:thiosulfate oxidation carrier protein SoxY n=1 Tax=Nioella nitratireducens TaxID=1287720 RepID=UPI0008FD45D3|nr:thiosulfate oxidation carrier protein SoxY [Nioella nitratireducens]